MKPRPTLRARQRLDKYRIVRRLAYGGFAEVYEAVDTVEGVRVALKIPHAHLVTRTTLEDFRREVRHTARLDHPAILPIKTAGHLGGRFVIVQPLGAGTLLDRLKHRIALRTQLAWAEQILEALAHAHARRIVHCDVKPENVLLFPGGRVRLADFGTSKVAQRTLVAGGTGTVGYIAPEQAMGRPSPRSDVFSAGLLLWRLFGRSLPEWPYRPPRPGADRLRRLHPELLAFLEKAIAVDETRRFRDAGAMLAAFRRLRPRVLARAERLRRRPRTDAPTGRHWRLVRQQQFRRAFARALELSRACTHCGGPLAEAMIACPWCAAGRKVARGMAARAPRCPRCQRSVKADWTYCAWCYGGAIGPTTTRALSDRRYAARCGHCRGRLMPFMRYCPWCRRRVSRPWPLVGSRERCGGCGWGVTREYWRTCPWCARRLDPGTRRGR